MDNNELNEKIIERVRNTIVISNLESEENMRLSKKKQVLSLVAVIMIMFVGGFATVNAATNGELADKVKEEIKKVVFVRDDGKEVEVEGETYTDSNNHIIEKYQAEEDGSEHLLKIDRTNLNEEDISVNATFKKDSQSIVIENKK